MKKALILHGTSGSPKENWFSWLEAELEKAGYEVWVPALPDADEPDIKKYNEHILKHEYWKPDEHTILIGHSSGAVAILGLLEALRESTRVQACFLVEAFKDDLGWDALQKLFVKPFDYKRISQKSRLWYFIHSDDDPYCPLSHAEYLHQAVGGDLLVIPGQKHFSVGTAGEKYREFPLLRNIIVEDIMTASYVASLYQNAESDGIKFWIDGGWAIDAHLGKQTRPHGDLDIAVHEGDAQRLKQHLVSDGFF